VVAIGIVVARHCLLQSDELSKNSHIIA
jgi:hypothetical protein